MRTEITCVNMTKYCFRKFLPRKRLLTWANNKCIKKSTEEGVLRLHMKKEHKVFFMCPSVLSCYIMHLPDSEFVSCLETPTLNCLVLDPKTLYQ